MSTSKRSSIKASEFINEGDINLRGSGVSENIAGLRTSSHRSASCRHRRTVTQNDSMFYDKNRDLVSRDSLIKSGSFGEALKSEHNSNLAKFDLYCNTNGNTGTRRRQSSPSPRLMTTMLVLSLLIRALKTNGHICSNMFYFRLDDRSVPSSPNSFSLKKTSTSLPKNTVLIFVFLFF